MLRLSAIGKKLKVERVKNGEVIGSYAGYFLDTREQRKAARQCGVSEDVIANVIKREPPAELRLTVGNPEQTFRVRGELQSAPATGFYPTVDAALHNATAEQVIEWQDNKTVCCLDIDFDSKMVPNATKLLAFAATIQPKPIHYWLSRSGGIHAIFTALDNYDADELASVAAYHFLRRYPYCKPELLHRTRVAPGDVYTSAGSTDVGILRSLLAENTQEENTSFLSDRGWEVGQRHPHTDCPVNPSRRGEKNTNPVVVLADKIICYICQADGRRCGSKTPGQFPFSAITGGRVETKIAKAVENFVHWSHAELILRQRIDRPPLARAIYSALLKLKHGDDARIPVVFTAAEPFGLIRYQGYWCDYNGDTVRVAANSPILSSLPQALTCDRVGNLDINLEAKDWLSQSINLSPKGYVPVTPVHGFQFTKWQELPEHKMFIVLHNATVPEARRPKYLAERDRHPEPWEEIEKSFPKIDRGLVELLLVARGCVEHRAGLPPMLFLTGPTGSGKTSHLQFAAAIAGDSPGTVHLERDVGRYYNALMSAKRKSGFVFFDEFFKRAKQAGLSSTQAMEDCLTFTEDKLVYMIHVGALPLGDLPLFAWADNEIPNEVLAHEQIGRRVFHRHLERELKWEPTLKEMSLDKIHELRRVCSDGLLCAMNTILSQVIDSHFLSPVTEFAVVAQEMGFKRIRESGFAAENREGIKRFCDAFAAASDGMDETDCKRYGKNWKKVKLDFPSHLLFTFQALQTPEEQDTINCRALAGADIASIMGLDSPVRYEFRKHGLTLLMRVVE